MITITAKINLLSGNNIALLEGSTFENNNISNELSNVVGTKKPSGNAFLLGSSKIGDGSALSNDVEYFIGKSSSNEQGIFEVPYSIDISDASGKGITAFTIVFDSLNGVHPKYIYVDGVMYEDDDSTFTITELDNKQSINIYIDNLNRGNYPLIIEGIYVDLSINIDKSNLISLTSKIVDRSNVSLPEFGIISNSSSITFIDRNEEILDYIKSKLLKDNLPVTITMSNTLNGKKETIGNFYTKNWDYDNDNKEIKLTIKDNLTELQEIVAEKGLEIDPSNPTGRTMGYIYNIIKNRTPSKFKFPALYQLPKNIQSILNNTYCSYPILQAESLWQMWNKLCQVCGLYIFCDFQGNITFSTDFEV